MVNNDVAEDIISRLPMYDLPIFSNLKIRMNIFDNIIFTEN